VRGLSRLEPLRATLLNEDAARRATTAFWNKGARPGMALTHPGQLSAPAQQRLKLQFDAIAAGADNTGSTVVLEEGMTPQKLSACRRRRRSTSRRGS
jgi:phage portal protein BeeE